MIIFILPATGKTVKTFYSPCPAVAYGVGARAVLMSPGPLWGRAHDRAGRNPRPPSVDGAFVTAATLDPTTVRRRFCPGRRPLARPRPEERTAGVRPCIKEPAGRSRRARKRPPENRRSSFIVYGDVSFGSSPSRYAAAVPLNVPIKNRTGAAHCPGLLILRLLLPRPRCIYIYIFTHRRRFISINPCD